MTLANTSRRYGSLSKFFHWSIALGILTLIPLGIIATDMAADTSAQLARKATLFSIHKTLGIAIFAIAVARILWALSQPKPAPLHPERKLETFAAETVHWLLYASLVIMPLSGWVHHAATDGFAPIWLIGQDLPFVPKDETLSAAASAVHSIFEKVLIVTLILHIAGALKHHVIDRDATLRRMLPGRTEAGTPARHGVLAPFGGAVAVIALALGIGFATGAPLAETGTSAPQLAQVQSDWEKQDGQIALTIRQFGKEVSGQFSDFTTEISYEDTPEPGTKGTVRVTVSVPSLTLGSVTDQAIGPDFFDAKTHPTAVFDADILRTEAGLIAEGTLTIRDQSVPLSLPFDLTIEGETAQMTGQLTLDRRDFGIGSQMDDPGQLGHDVQLDLSLTATRAAKQDLGA